MTSSVNSLKIYNSPGRSALTLIASLLYACVRVCLCVCAGAEFAILVYGLVLCACFRFDCCCSHLLCLCACVPWRLSLFLFIFHSNTLRIRIRTAYAREVATVLIFFICQTFILWLNRAEIVSSRHSTLCISFDKLKRVLYFCQLTGIAAGIFALIL